MSSWKSVQLVKNKFKWGQNDWTYMRNVCSWVEYWLYSQLHLPLTLGSKGMSLNQPCTPGCSTWSATRFGPSHGHSSVAAVPCRSEERFSSQVTALSWVTCRTGWQLSYAAEALLEPLFKGGPSGPRASAACLGKDCWGKSHAAQESWLLWSWWAAQGSCHPYCTWDPLAPRMRKVWWWPETLLKFRPLPAWGFLTFLEVDHFCMTIILSNPLEFWAVVWIPEQLRWQCVHL